MSTKLAPITLFVYNRPNHAQNVIDALAKNDLANDTDLFIFSDGPKNIQDLALVSEVRNLIWNVRGFKNVTIIERNENWGLSKSIISGVTDVVERYGRIIVLEDDLVTSRYFLKYMNVALEMYEQEEQVISVHAYTPPVGDVLPRTFFLRGTGCWGWATWGRGWQMFQADGNVLLRELRRNQLEQAFDMYGAYPYTRMLNDQVNGRNDSWAIRWHATGFLYNMLTLHFENSLVSNIGLDGSGTHCGAERAFTNILSNDYREIEKIDAVASCSATETIAKFYRKQKPCMISRILHWLNSTFF